MIITPSNKNYKELEFIEFDLLSLNSLPLYASRISAGFPSPADDYIELSINIGEYIAPNAVSTFFVRVKGDSMINAHILHDSILTVDKSLKPKHNDIIVCSLDGEFTVKRLIVENNQIILKPENDNYKPTLITEDMDFRIWGVVTFVINKIN